METFLQKLAKDRKDEKEVTILPVVQPPRRHGASCDCGDAGCGGQDEGCCGG